MNTDSMFEWDERKNIENIVKHDISFDEAKLAFADKKRIILLDDKHSGKEERMYCIGKTYGRIVMVRFVYRNGHVRIFGAGYWRRAKSIYEKKNCLHGRAE